MKLSQPYLSEIQYVTRNQATRYTHTHTHFEAASRRKPMLGRTRFVFVGVCLTQLQMWAARENICSLLRELYIPVGRTQYRAPWA